MSVWYECGNGLVTTSWARADLQTDAYLCCPGPSLRDVDPKILHAPGIMTFALNTAYPKIRPDMWIGLDDPRCYDPNIWWEPFPKFTRMSVYKGVDLSIFGGQHLRSCPNTFFPDLEEMDPAKMFEHRAHNTTFVWNKNAFIFALHLMIWMGARRIRLVGCDFGGRADYHDDRVLTPSQRACNLQLYGEIVQTLRRLVPLAERYGIEIVSCTPDAPTHDFMRHMTLEDAVAESRRRVPARPGSTAGATTLHCLDADLCRWSVPSKGDGIVVGCAPSQDWMLDWWWDHYRGSNTLPVAFADFGLSDTARAWCAARGTIIDVASIPAEGWFRKPFALLRSPFQRSLWLDLDTQVRGDLSPIFAGVAGDRLAMGLSTGRISPEGRWHTHVPDNLTMYCTSAVAVANGASAIEAWAERTLSAQADYNGDHEVLSDLVHALGLDVAAFAPDAFVQHDAGSEALISHWGGWSGKRHIRRQIGAFPAHSQST